MSKYPTMTAQAFKALRETIGAQQDVAEDMQTSRRTLNRWETGERRIPGVAAVCITKLAAEASLRRQLTMAAVKKIDEGKPNA